ncbi:nucleotidyltransferase [Bacillus sp. FJAT-47783]|uniref:nucleotidyltransferase n=1 Tax=Bacillus sp. FJAT-47783 TaxID=2922712 RepID=UPI001FADF641|nr:nucleotidyltransferase [Bacillus sp. FJAT-47783]
MNALGLVVEYNPFHNGHLYHLTESKKETKADVVIAVMSGYFLQRGEPALISKWTRAKMALRNGVDIVVELPYAYSTQSAELFAKGAVSILDSLYCQSLCFGSELGKIEPFLKTRSLLKEKQPQYETILKKVLQQGYSYPKAKSIAFAQVMDGEKELVDLSQPNNILGYQYINAIETLQSEIEPRTIKRIGGGYNDEALHETTISSATSIRKALFETKDLSSLRAYVPSPTYEHLYEYEQSYHLFHRWENYFPYLKYAILTKSTDELANIYEMEEGLEYRMKAKIKEADSFYPFIEAVKTKRYTWTRLQRVCVHILTNTKKDWMKEAGLLLRAPYIRLLGMNKKGQKYLKHMKKKIEVPVIAKLSAYDLPLLHLDIKAANVYALAIHKHNQTDFLNKEYSTPPLRYDEEQNVFLT